jgi:hypothetical protein
MIKKQLYFEKTAKNNLNSKKINKQQGPSIGFDGPCCCVACLEALDVRGRGAMRWRGIAKAAFLKTRFAFFMYPTVGFS